MSAFTRTNRFAQPGHDPAKSHPERSVCVIERRPRTLFLQRSHLLPQSQILEHEVCTATAHRTNYTSTNGNEENDDAEHSGGVCTSWGRELKRTRVLSDSNNGAVST